MGLAEREVGGVDACSASNLMGRGSDQAKISCKEDPLTKKLLKKKEVRQSNTKELKK